jgi:hypothetical protein
MPRPIAGGARAGGRARARPGCLPGCAAAAGALQHAPAAAQGGCRAVPGGCRAAAPRWALFPLRARPTPVGWGRAGRGKGAGRAAGGGGGSIDVLAPRLRSIEAINRAPPASRRPPPPIPTRCPRSAVQAAPGQGHAAHAGHQAPPPPWPFTLYCTRACCHPRRAWQRCRRRWATARGCLTRRCRPASQTSWPLWLPARARARRPPPGWRPTLPRP